MLPLLIESVLIIVTLGGLEIVLWYLGQKEIKEQTQLLEDIAITLSLKEGTNAPGSELVAVDSNSSNTR